MPTSLPSDSSNGSKSASANLDERKRELYKYFQPRSFKVNGCDRGKRSADPTLTSYAQLATWRLDARRCTISLFDENTQYNVAEATKTLRLHDGTWSETPEDKLWMGCTSFDSNGSMCLHTLNAPVTFSPADGEFEVLDLTKDERFCDLPFVTGFPNMRYYYAVTFSTRRGVKIGTVCLLDDKARQPMQEEQRLFLYTMAKNVYLHLELMRERDERKRATKMNQCLSLFMNADESMLARRKRRQQSRTPSISNLRIAGTSRRSPRKQRGVLPNQASDSESSSQEYGASKSEQDAKGVHSQDDDHLEIFSKAADLLRTSLDLEEGGGVVFLDSANAGNSTAWTQKSPSSTRKSDHEQTYRSVRRGSTCVQTAAEVLASSTTHDSSYSPIRADREPDPDLQSEPAFTAMLVDTLAMFIERYPQGKLWVFDSHGHVVSDSEDDASPSEFHSEVEAAAILLHHFPGAHQIISLPLWDPRSTRWAMCFAYSTSSYRTFTFETDLLHCIAFTNCVTIEMGRLATLAADKLKGDFISSISHELRSPLHGILASCEFLQEETEASSFQSSLVHTIKSCSRTLLDTISMILDYTKINSFERDWKRVAKPQKGSSQPLPGEASIPGGLTSRGQPALSIYGHVDLAAITEEVVEGVTAGQEHHDVLTVNFSDTGNTSRIRVKSNDATLGGVVVDGKPVVRPSAPVSKGQVEVILDIEPRSWTYVTQPGAFRRVVMNLVGNALKYTSRGWIRVHLTAESSTSDITQASAGSAERDVLTDMVVLTVIDTGKGISPEYLRTKLFTAFAQEDHLASGTGLGLSLVRSILKILNGDIDITSTVGSGTTVVARIPMISQSGSGTPASSNTPSTGSSGAETVKDDSVALLRNLPNKRKVAIFSSSKPRQLINGLDIRAGVHAKIRKYTVDWCGLTVVPWTHDCHADLIIADEDDLEVLLSQPPNPHNPSRLIYCSYASRPGLVKAHSKTPRIDFMSKPFGPYKLARALRVCLQHGPGEVVSELDTIKEPKPADVLELDRAVVEGKLNSNGVEVNVVEAGGVVGKDDSTNAHMALDDSEHPSTSTSLTDNSEGQEFPFTTPTSKDQVTSPSVALRPALRDRRTMSPTASELKKMQKKMGGVLSTMTPAGQLANTVQPGDADSTASTPTANSREEPPKAAAVAAALTATASRDPRLLLVDDNAINLRLLQTFMKKRKYTSVLSAKDGLEAVQAFSSAAASGSPPDIVFMDISMPVMNGFEATRRIRAMEEESNALCADAADAKPSALIIALTGLASGKDQSEAFIAGVDLYMTKPVSFKEVGRLLDNWFKNGGAAKEGSGVPHGALTGGAGVAGAGLKVEKEVVAGASEL